MNEIQRIGFAGLGAMGAGIVERLHEGGHSVTVWNRTADKALPLLDAGVEWAPTPRDLAASVDAVFTMLTDTAAVEATAAGDDGLVAGLRPNAIWADLSTIAPDASVALAERVREVGAFFLDCPVSGSPATLAAGQLSVMAGGDRAAFDHLAPVLRAIGPKVTYVGPNGHAILTKIAINLALVVSVTAFAEGVALAEKAGVAREPVVEAVLRSVIASPVIGYRAPLLVDDTAVYADVELQQKDLVLAQQLARRLGMAVPTCAATSEMLSAARSSPRADRDFVVSVHQAYLRLGGTA
ncbi:MAG: NAD(P)-dependent oxidoreductase [Actinomycetota bacterium]|nr:NAD(P)-dependent oxidoreductase [Actinomycetota bacterium]